MISGGRLDVKDVIQPTYDEINKKYGTQRETGLISLVHLNQ